MKTIRIVGLCLVAVFAFSAFAANSAFATELLPLFLVEEDHSFPVGVKDSAAKEEGTLWTAKHEVKCKNVHVNGSILKEGDNEREAHLALVDLLFEECSGEKGVAECGNDGSKTMITTDDVLVHLGIIEPEKIKGLLFLIPTTEFTCEALFGLVKEEVVVKGDIIGKILGSDEVYRESMEVEFAQKAKGEPDYDDFTLSLSLEKVTALLGTSVNKGAVENSSEVTKQTVDSEIPVEIHLTEEE